MTLIAILVGEQWLFRVYNVEKRKLNESSKARPATLFILIYYVIVHSLNTFVELNYNFKVKNFNPISNIILGIKLKF